MTNIMYEIVGALIGFVISLPFVFILVYFSHYGIKNRMLKRQNKQDWEFYKRSKKENSPDEHREFCKIYFRL